MAKFFRWMFVALFVSSGLMLMFATISVLKVADLSRKNGGFELDATAKSFGEVVSGTTTTVRFVFNNRSNQPLTVLGGRKVCFKLACFDTIDLPIEVSPGDKRSISVKVLTRGHGDFAEEMIFYTDQVDQTSISVKIEGRVVEGPDAT